MREGKGNRIPPRVVEIIEIGGPVIAAAALAFMLDLIINRPRGPVDLVGRSVGYPIVVLILFLIGRWFGKRTWPKRGLRLSARILRRASRDGKHAMIFTTGRPETRSTLSRRALEVVGFSAGVSILTAAAMQIFGAPPNMVRLVGSILTLVMPWASFLLVPYWLYTRVGLRRVDPVRWLILPMGGEYAERLKLSNGALLVVAAIATVNLAYRAGASQEEALLQGVVTVMQLVASVLVIATTAVVYYGRAEADVAAGFGDVTSELRIADGSGMSDGDFLPRLRERT